jgi:large subunit ribosomal protein L18
MDKKQSRLRRAKRTRCKIKELGVTRLSVHKTPQHMYVQLVGSDGKILLAVSTLEKDIKSAVKHTGNIAAAKLVGKTVAERGIKKGIKQVAFDRSGFKYHGRVKALAEAAREQGFEF